MSSKPPTKFQEAVWSTVKGIPRGRVTTYGDIAAALGKPGAKQAVGNALSGCPGDVPWWRVVRAGGYLNPAREFRYAQIVLLEHEGVTVDLRVIPRRIIKPKSG